MEQNFRNILEEAVFTEVFDQKEYGTRTLYFDVPAEWAKGYFEGIRFNAAEVSISYPINRPEPGCAEVLIMAAEETEGERCVLDFDTFDISEKEIEDFFTVARKAGVLVWGV